jgi:hypothetical protein
MGKIYIYRDGELIDEKEVSGSTSVEVFLGGTRVLGRKVVPPGTILTRQVEGGSDGGATPPSAS